MKKNYFTFILFCIYFLPIQAGNLLHITEGFNGVDLELSMNTPNLTPGIYTSIPANITLTNTGNETATNITVSIPVPDGFVLTGSNPYDLTDGDYSSFFGRWTLDNLAPGASQTLTLNIYTLTENPVDLYGEVTEMDGSDTDSTPGNGTPVILNEDDEAVLQFNGVSGPGLPDLNIFNLTVPSSISLGELTTLEYQFNNIGEAIASGPFTVFFYYSEDNQLNFGDQQFGQETYSNIPAGASQGEQYNFVLLSSLGITPGTGYIIAKIDNDNTVLESNENNNVTVSTPVTVNTINNNGNIDLELSLNQTNNSPDQYSAYSVQLSVFNNGTGMATDVKVSVPRPDGVVYTGSNPYNTNTGQFSTSSDIYRIPSINPGETVILTVNYFLLNEQAPIVYAQVTQTTESDSDSTPNNGTPPRVNEDDEASTGTGVPPVDLANLSLTESFVPPVIERERATEISYTLWNIGLGTAEGPFDVSYYYSSDDQLNAGDQLVGQRSFASFSGGDVSDEIDEITLLASLGIPVGSGYLLIVADSENLIMESNENNNIRATPIYVLPISQAPECATTLGAGFINCISRGTNGDRLFFTRTNSFDGTVNRFFSDIDMNGNLTRSEEIGEMDAEITYQTINETNQNNILQKLENGVPVEEMIIPTSIIDNYDFITGATSFNDGFMLFAVLGFDLIVILTDENLNPITNSVIPSGESFSTTPKLNKALQINPDQVALIFTENNGFVGSSTSLVVVNGALEKLSERFLDASQFSGGDLRRTICNDFILSSSTFSQVCGGQCGGSSSLEGGFNNGVFVEFSGSTRSSRTVSSPNGTNTTSSFSRFLQTEDGGKIVVSSGSGSNQVLIEKMLNGTVVSNQTIELSGVSIDRILEISGTVYLVVYNVNDLVTRYYDIDCLEDVDPPTEGVDLELTSALSDISPDIYSNYSVVYTLVNNGTETATGIEVEFLLPDGTVYKGSNPFSISRGNMSSYNNLYTLDELPAGETAVIELNYFSLTDASLNHYAEVVAINEEDVDSTPDNGTPLTVNEDDETVVSTQPMATTNAAFGASNNSEIKRLEILKLYPNPVMEKDIRMTLNIPESADQTFVIFNELGIEVLRRSYNLSAGFNEISLPTKNLTAGIYHLLLPGNHTRFGSARFMVIK